MTEVITPGAVSAQIDFNNYIAQRKSTNCVVFIHKKRVGAGTVKNETKVNEQPIKRSKTERTIRNKPEIINNSRTCAKSKHILPIILPKNDISPIIYTIKRRKESHPKTSSKKTQTDIKPNLNLTSMECDSLSSEINTILDRNITKCLSGTISEISGKKSNETASVGSSEKSLRKRKEKADLIGTIQGPILKVINECLNELKEYKEEIYDIKAKNALLNTITLKTDKVYDKLCDIEKQICNKPNHTIKVPKREELTEIVQIQNISRDNNESNEEVVSPNITSVDYCHEGEPLELVSKEPLFNTDRKVGHLNKIPARFCWTDASNHRS